MTTRTRKLQGLKIAGSPASLSPRLSIRPTELAATGRVESCFRLPVAERNEGFLRIGMDPGRLEVFLKPAVKAAETRMSR